MITSLDALVIINHLNAQPSQGEGEAEADAAFFAFHASSDTVAHRPPAQVFVADRAITPIGEASTTSQALDATEIAPANSRTIAHAAAERPTPIRPASEAVTGEIDWLLEPLLEALAEDVAHRGAPGDFLGIDSPSG